MTADRAGPSHDVDVLLSHASPQCHRARHAEAVAVLQEYFDGLHHSDTQRLRRVFHPQAVYATACHGKPLVLGMDEYFRMVDARPSPASKGEVRTDEVVSIEFAGPVTACATLRCSIQPRHFVDLLTLIHLDDRWQVVAKAFHWEERPRQACG